MTHCLRTHAFSLKDTLECGQFFRYTKAMETYIVQSSDRIFSIWQKSDSVLYEGVDGAFLTHFFRLDEDLDSVLKEIDRDPIIHRAIQKYRGMRLIRQDPWECFLSFLCSSAKAIPQIRCIIESLCKSSGRKVPFGNYISYGFPEPQSIKPSPQLESIQAGFRTHYLIEAGRCIDRHQLLALKSLPHLGARQRLMKLAGVGKKVADCVLLYSLDFLEAFPIDTWIKKGLQESYFNGRRVGGKAMEEFVSKHFGPYAGYAQLYLYHFWRNSKPDEKV
jgi:N-glycosylase/DNA lyase